MYSCWDAVSGGGRDVLRIPWQKNNIGTMVRLRMREGKEENVENKTRNAFIVFPGLVLSIETQSYNL